MCVWGGGGGGGGGCSAGGFSCCIVKDKGGYMWDRRMKYRERKLGLNFSSHLSFQLPEVARSVVYQTLKRTYITVGDRPYIDMVTCRRSIY